MYAISMRVCRTCHEEKEDHEFYSCTMKSGRLVIKTDCKSCYKQFPKSISGIIFRRYKRQDKIHGLSNDLDLSFVRSMMSKHCHWCGTSSRIRGLDRINYTKGHTKNNVVTACRICNTIRMDIPVKAWIVIAEGLKEAESKGLFENWSPINEVQDMSKRTA